MSIKNKKSHNRQKKLLLGLSILVLLVSGALLAYWYVSTHPASDKTADKIINGINYNPPTDEEKHAGDEKKQEIVKEETKPQPSDSASANVTITYGELYNGQIEVGASVLNLFEEGGTCKLALKRGSQEFTSTVTAVRNAKTTDCPVMSVDRNQLAAGTWTAVVTYSSATASGTSQPKEIIVQ